MYLWHTNTFPSAPFDTQIFIDINGDIYKYSSIDTTWKRYHEAQLRHTRSYMFPGSGASLFGRVPQDYDGEAFFSKSFVSVEYYADGPVLMATSYLAHPTEADIVADYAVKYPGGGASVILHVYDVFDPRLNINRITGSNNMYGSYRGRNHYYNAANRGRQNFGPDGGFHIHWTQPYNDFGDYLMNQIWGIYPIDGFDNEEAIWNSVGKRSLYHQPRVGSVVKSGGSNRRAYRASADAYVQVVDMRFNVGTPWVFYQDYGTMNRSLSAMSTLKGSTLVTRRMNCMLIYPLRTNDGDYYAFLLKPYGITHVSIRAMNTDGISTIAEMVCKNSRKMVPRILTATGTNQFKMDYSIWDIIYARPASVTSLDNNVIPDHVKLYRKDFVNGARSEYHDGIIKINKHKTNAPIFMTITRNR